MSKRGRLANDSVLDANYYNRCEILSVGSIQRVPSEEARSSVAPSLLTAQFPILHRSDITFDRIFDDDFLDTIVPRRKEDVRISDVGLRIKVSTRRFVDREYAYLAIYYVYR